MTTETSTDLSLKSWPYPTHEQLQQCWYICTACWGFHLTLDLHRQHREKYHADVIREEGYRLKVSLITFIDDAQSIHENWSEGTSPISQCYQRRIASLTKAASRNIAILDDASVVFKFEDESIFERETEYFDSDKSAGHLQPEQLAQALFRIRDDHLLVCGVMEDSDCEVKTCDDDQLKKKIKWADEAIVDESKEVFKAFLDRNRNLDRYYDSDVDQKTIETALAEMFETRPLEVHTEQKASQREVTVPLNGSSKPISTVATADFEPKNSSSWKTKAGKKPIQVAVNGEQAVQACDYGFKNKKKNVEETKRDRLRKAKSFFR